MSVKTNQLLMGLAGGLVSALLLVAMTRGGPFAFPLATLFPLPIAIASLGWGSPAGFVAAAAAAGLIAGIASWPAGLAFLVVSAAPMAWYAHQAGLARPRDENDPRAGLEWYPLGRILASIVAVTAATLIGAIWAGDLVGDEMAASLTAMFTQIAEQNGPITDEQRAMVPEVVAAYLRLLPTLAGATWVAIMALNLWLGARVTKASGRLDRPWEPVPEAIALPQLALPIFAGALLLDFAGGAAGLIGGVVSGALGMGFALVGLAVIHVRTRGSAVRPMMLGGLYVLLFVFAPVLLILALVGIVDTARSLRGAQGPASTP